MASRRIDIKTMSSLWGNAAAHRALYGSFAFPLHEATLYEAQAERIAAMRTWNEEEIHRLSERTKREARNILRRRKEDWREKTFDDLCAIADSEIDEYIVQVHTGRMKQDEETSTPPDNE
jgi:hypothetical protein